MGDRSAVEQYVGCNWLSDHHGHLSLGTSGSCQNSNTMLLNVNSATQLSSPAGPAQVISVTMYFYILASASLNFRAV